MYLHGGNIYKNKYKLDFSTNINLEGISENVILAACEGVKLANQYPDIECYTLREAISKSRNIPINHVICGNGAADLIYSLCLALKPKKTLLPVPSFYEYEQALHVIESEIEYFYMKDEQEFLLQEDFLQAIHKDLDLIFLCNPNNPTGNLIKKERMLCIIKKCEENHTFLVVDECFMDFVDERDKNTIIDQCCKSNYLFILKAFTKLYAMPGLRLGYGISGNVKLLKKMREVTQPWNVSIPAQMAGIAALKEEEYVTESLKTLKKERIYLIQELINFKFKIYGSNANYIFFRTNPGLYELCIDKGILIRDCSNYEGLKEGYYRIAIKKHEDNEQLVNILKEVVTKWQNQS